MTPTVPDPSLAFSPWSLLCLGIGLVAVSSLYSALLWLGHRREAGLGHVLAASGLQGLGLLGCLISPRPEGLTLPLNLVLLLGAGYGLWALRSYAGLPARMNRWGWVALGCWVLVAVAFHAMGFRWVRGLAVPATLAVLALGMARELGRLLRDGEGRAPAQVCAVLAIAMALAALGAGLTVAYALVDSGVYSAQVRAWFFFGILGTHQVSTFLLAQVQGQRLRQRLDGLAATDALTGLASAKGFQDRLDRAVGRSLRTGRISSVLVLDLDGFEAMVEAHGQGQVVRIQEAFACTLNSTLREADLGGHLEGGRFVALMHQTPPFEALLAAERLRSTWENLPLQLGAQALRSTLSGGVASTREAIENAEDLLALAIGRARSARAGGGNNVEGEP